MESGIAILYTSHNMRDVEEVCDRVLFMHKGKVVTEGSPKEVVERFQQTDMEGVFIRIVREGDIEEQKAES
jgi:ABC-2 type transport system ATP-binding protein